MDELPPEPKNLTFLRRLVTILTATMILGVGTIVVLLFLRLSASDPISPPAAQGPMIPEEIILPDGLTAIAVTFGADWYAVVTDTDEILIFNQADGSLRQRIQIEQ